MTPWTSDLPVEGTSGRFCHIASLLVDAQRALPQHVRGEAALLTLDPVTNT